MLKEYYILTKPGIVYGNLLTALAGYLLVTNVHLPWLHLLGSMIGFCLIVAAACVTNNYLDIGLDARMQRTKNRPLVTGSVTPQNALYFAAGLGILGCVAVGWSAGRLALLIELIGYVLYVVVYGVAKRRTAYGTLIGSLSGAIPPLAGYAAFHHSLAPAAWALFLAVTLWQMPHFYGISLYRYKDYQTAGLPVWPVKYGKAATKRQAILYIGLYILAVLVTSHYARLGWLFATIITVFNLWWLSYGLRFWSLPPKQWGRSMFLYSLGTISLLSLGIIGLGLFHSWHFICGG